MAAAESLTPYYRDEAVTIYHGDCASIVPLLGQVDHTITDPPYDNITHNRNTLRKDGGPAIKAIPFAPLTGMTEHAQRIAAATRRWAVVFCAWRMIEKWAASFEACDWKAPRMMIWVKPDGRPEFTGRQPAMNFEPIVLAHPVGHTEWNGGGARGVLEHNSHSGIGGPAYHPTEKPIALMRELVSLFTNPGDLVLDPFMGSGSTLRACKDLGRKAIGIEVDEGYCAVAVKRMQQEVLPIFG